MPCGRLYSEAKALPGTSISASCIPTIPKHTRQGPAPDMPQQYTVKEGDTMFDIALKFGITLEALTAANPGVNPERIFPGQVLNVPVK